MFQFCIGQIGINSNDFWLMSYKEIILAMRGYQERELEEWKRTRYVAYMIYCSVPKKKGTSNMSIERFMPLGEKKRGISKDAFDQLRKTFTSRVKKEENDTSK